ncbi:hypothetical protein PMIN01_12756 [Paraphaeosphaeria minitans]|uniref:CCHC-type domain-containing protein n=1 Tax=Paraphaeosphaeria minitans TaxID=565426 RepID=A0A9P6G4R9_9PLEO|nr:hypothetical protein PMIN01_12756 [Paraphaeosphaeria minitans]
MSCPCPVVPSWPASHLFGHLPLASAAPSRHAPTPLGPAIGAVAKISVLGSSLPSLSRPLPFDTLQIYYLNFASLLKMARTFGPALNTIGDNPYASARHKKPDFHTCKACDRTISSKDWAAHNSSKKHFACEDEMRRAAKKPVDTKSPAMDKEANIVSFAQGAWKQDDGAPYLRGDETDVCYGCGESGHFKREW